MIINHDGTPPDLIAEALVSYGVSIWQGIPEAILERLESSGYVIKKKRTEKFGTV